MKKRHIKLWLILAVAVVFSTIGTGFYKNLSADSAETYRGLKLFSDVIEIVEKTYVDDVDTKELIEKAIHGMVHSLDPHSSLLLPDALNDLQIDTQGEFTGIGIRITMRKGYVTVISPIVDTPAYKAGIEVGDKIIEVDGQAATELREAVKMIRGPKGTQVVITIIREGIKEPIDFTLTRDVIPIESVKSIALKPGYGYIWVTNFRDNTTEDLVTNLDQFESGNLPLKGLILDLRNNPGGLLNQAIMVSDLFLENGTILSIKGRLKKNTKNFEAKPNIKKREYPIIVLINGGSASASEIVAGALQDHKRALILGTASFGKGSVQTVETLRDGYGLKLTIARYYTPSGRSIQAKGIEPDVIVKKGTIDTQETEDLENSLTKEKDLENHLDAMPDKKQNDTRTKDKRDGSEKPDPDSLELNEEQLQLERLRSDNQVMRALDILLSYDIFKRIHP
ncbi:MAG: S41 family peptidase [Desulfobacterales bacterium]|nr:MAG: S41 family peptidase [Desulfobacterales bacterium]